jgi:uncharacterized membrane protein HdeD (DUF308 family)
MNELSIKIIKKPSNSSMLLRSIVNIIFGIILLFFPGLTLWVLSIALSVNLLIIGLFMVFEPAIDKTNKHAFLTALFGVLSIFLGIYLLTRPLAGVAVLTIIFAAWALMFGIIDLILGFKLTELKQSQSWLFYTAGALSIVFAIFILFNPIQGSLTIVWAIGLYSLVVGIITGYNAIVGSKTKAQKAPKKSKKKGKK